MYHPICVLICSIFAFLSFPTLPTSSSCVLCGIKVWIRQMDRALDQSERSILPRLAETIYADWRTSDGQADPSQSVLVSSGLGTAQFSMIWFKSCLVLFRSDMFGFGFWNVVQFVSKCSFQFINLYFRINSPSFKWILSVLVSFFSSNGKNLFYTCLFYT